jgi:hypothetical protein
MSRYARNYGSGSDTIILLFGGMIVFYVVSIFIFWKKNQTLRKGLKEREAGNPSGFPAFFI